MELQYTEDCRLPNSRGKVDKVENLVIFEGEKKKLRKIQKWKLRIIKDYSEA